MKYMMIAVFALCFSVCPAALAQSCEQHGTVEVRLQDENEKPVRNASIKFVEGPKGYDGTEFTEYAHSYGSEYVGRYCESEVVGKDQQKKFRRQYEVAITAKGYHDLTTNVSIYHCLGSCLVNRQFVTVVNESAKLVTVRGTVKLESSKYDGKGRVVNTRKVVNGAPIVLRRSTMVEFRTVSDAKGNYEITVPVGSYDVYATAAPGCFMCAEYFGKVLAADQPTKLAIVLRFYGEG